MLFLVADTGGGHRAAARAVAERLQQGYPGRFGPVLIDPLAGQGSPWPLRRIIRLYGPVARRAPWLWGALPTGPRTGPAGGTREPAGS